MMKVATTLLSSLPSRLLSAGVFLLFIFLFVSYCSFVKTTAVRSRSTTRPQRRQTNTAQHVPAKASRIVGGEKSNRDRFPYFVYMNGDTACGAVLISKRFILTAAHCRDADLNFVVGGGSNNGNDNNNYNNTNQETSSSSSHFYIDKIIHPMYDPITFSNDIALFQLQQDYDKNIVITGDGDNNNNNSSSIVGHNDDVPYVRLSNEIIEKVGTEMTVIGFGITTTGNNNNTNDLDNDNDNNNNNNTKIVYAEDLHQVDVYYV